MTAFEISVLAMLVLMLIGIVVLLALLLKARETVDWAQKLETIDVRLSDNLAIVNLGVSGLRDENAKGSSLLREEIATRVDGLGKSLQNTLTTLGTQQTERLDSLTTDQSVKFDSFRKSLAEHRTASGGDAKSLRDEVQNSLTTLSKKVTDGLETSGRKQTEELTKTTTSISELTHKNEVRQESLKIALENRLDVLRDENSKKLEEMRVTVDEKLQGTLEKRLGASFSVVNENLERVFKSVGEMQALATGVGDLKRVLSNVKLRGTWGEGTLGIMLEQMLTQEQYATNVEVRPRSGQRVEFAVKLPGADETPIWVPIDSKMPNEDYERLMLASEQGDAAAVEASAKALERRVLQHAKDISEKYVCPPHTTDFGVLFLPTEGLFAEVVRRPGLVEQLQARFRISVTGPTTLMAFLHSLRMGFRSLAIQERSSEVWQVLGAVKTEFGKFGPVLEKVQKKLGEAQNAIGEAHTRKRAMDRQLRDVEALTEAVTPETLALPPILDAIEETEKSAEV